MLEYPADQPTLVTICGIDPGTECLGLSSIEFDVATRSIVKISANTLVSSRSHHYSSRIEELHGAQFARMQAHYETLRLFFMRTEPIAVACESPFYFKLRPGAYGPLSETMQAIKRSLFDSQPNTPFFVYPPSTVKKAVSAGAHCGKDEMRVALLKHSLVVKYYDGDISLLDEHSLDAIAVAITFFNTQLITECADVSPFLIRL